MDAVLLLVLKNEQTYFNLVYFDLDTKSSPKNEASPPEANTNSTGSIISLFVVVDINLWSFTHFYTYTQFYLNIKASADGTPKKSPTSSSGFHHHVVMTDKSGALNVYVQVLWL